MSLIVPTRSSPGRATTPRCVLAVVDLNHPVEPVIARAAFAAAACDAPIKLVLLAPRPGIGTDAARIGHLHERLRKGLADLVAAARRRAPERVDPVADLVWYARWPMRNPVGQARRAAAAAADRFDAQVVILPPSLRADAVAGSGARLAAAALGGAR